MRPPSTAELLDAWEQGSNAPPYRRALALLAAACPDLSFQEIGQLTIGQRDTLLLTLREWTFGSNLASVATCVACGERLEWTVNASDLRVAGHEANKSDLTLDINGYYVSFRLPNSADLEIVAQASEASTAQQSLLERCVTDARLEDKKLEIKCLPPEVTEAIARRMGEADPQADVQLDLSCPACGHRWQALLDIEVFFWTELCSWARGLLSEVHTLACAYGWREVDILNLTPWRRQYYMALVGG